VPPGVRLRPGGMEHGAGPAIRDFSIVHHISAAAWSLALVSMALCEVTARLVIVQVRGQQLVPRIVPQCEGSTYEEVKSHPARQP